ncbi:5508_t:CDS:2, partial [Ambispora gerdemannii]
MAIFEGSEFSLGKFVDAFRRFPVFEWTICEDIGKETKKISSQKRIRILVARQATALYDKWTAQFLVDLAHVCAKDRKKVNLLMARRLDEERGSGREIASSDAKLLP